MSLEDLLGADGGPDGAGGDGDGDDNPFSFAAFAATTPQPTPAKPAKGKRGSSRKGGKAKADKGTASGGGGGGGGGASKVQARGLLDDDSPFPELSTDVPLSSSGGGGGGGGGKGKKAPGSVRKRASKAKDIAGNPLEPLARSATGGAGGDEDNPFSFGRFIGEPTDSAAPQGKAPAAAANVAQDAEAATGGKGPTEQEAGAGEANPFSFTRFISAASLPAAEPEEGGGGSGSALDVTLPDVFVAKDGKTMSPGKSAVANRVKRRLSDLQDQLTRKEEELSVTQEHFNAQFERLKDENAALREELTAAQDSLSKANRKGKDLSRQLKAKQSSEAEETAALEQMAERVEKSLQEALSRAATAEARVAFLENELRFKQANPLTPSDLDVVKSASSQLDAAAHKAKDSIRTLLEQASSLHMVSDLLMSVAHIGPFDPANQQHGPGQGQGQGQQQGPL